MTYSLDNDSMKALNLPIRLQKGKETKVEAENRVKKEMKAKENAFEQINALMTFKESLVNGILLYLHMIFMQV